MARQSALGATTSVLATLVAGWLGTSPTAKLAAAALTAIITIFVTTPGGKHKWRVLLGMAATVIALFFTYGGFTLFDYAADREATFPLPPSVPEPGPGDDGDDGGGGGAARLSVTPEQLRCDADGCASLVKITNTGAGPVGIGSIEIVDQVGGTFARNDRCESRTLAAEGEFCRFSVTYSPPESGDPSRARLIVNHDGEGDARVVELEAEEGVATTDLVPDPSSAQCAYTPGDAGGTFPITFTLAPDVLPAEVRIVATSGDQQVDETTVTTGGPITLSPQGDAIADTNQVTIAVDVDEAVDEPDEADNSFSVTVTRPSDPSIPLDPGLC